MNKVIPPLQGRLACQYRASNLIKDQRTPEFQGLELDIILEDIVDVIKCEDTVWSDLSSRLQSSNTTTSVHLPFYGLNPGCRNSAIRETGYKFVSKGLEIAGMLGAECAVMHTGFLPVVSGKARIKWLDTFIFEFSRLKRVAEAFGVRLLLENTWELSPCLFFDMEKMLGEPLEYCFDFGHANVFSKVPGEEWISFMNGRIFLSHLHDNSGIDDSHLPLGRGNIDFAPVVKLRNPGGLPRFVFEHKVVHLSDSVRHLNDCFLQKLD